MSRSTLVRGGGPRGHYLLLDCVPTSTLKGEIDAFIAAGTVYAGWTNGKFVYLSYGANYEVDSPAAGARVDGKIIAGRYDDLNSTYRLSCAIWSFADDNGNVYSAQCISNGPHTGGALGMALECSSTTTFFTWSDADVTGRNNMLIALDVPASGFCDVIHG